MNILDHLISTLDLDATVRDVRQGVFHTAVLTRNCGLAATLPMDALRQTPPLVKGPGTLLGKTPEELVQLARSESILEASIGMAAINSLLAVDDGSEEVGGVELLVADVFEQRAVQFVGAARGGGDDDSAVGAAVFGCIAVGHDFHFCHGFDGRI